MKELLVHAESKKSRILIGEKISNLYKYLPKEKKVIIISDTNIITIYKDAFPKGVPIIDIGLTEKTKTLSTVDLIFDKLIEYEADRTSFIVGIGGGIVCDVAGFAASVFMRGLPFGFVSTSLLSQVDASVGGKNGVNHKGYKNMIGVFNQPEFVICDIQMLETLSNEEFISGFAEIIKAGLIKDRELYFYCKENAKKALQKDPEIIEELVYRSVKIKADVVEADEKEKGERRLLNLGHTFGHAIEKMTGLLHGKAIGIGMTLATIVSYQQGMITEDDKNEILDVIKSYHLPTTCPIPISDLFEAMKQDKKRTGDSIHLILIESIGNAVTKKVTYNELQTITHDLRSHI